MISSQAKNSALGANLNAVLKESTESYFKATIKKIKPSFPIKANPLFCTFDTKIAKHINRVAFCFFMQEVNYYLYDLSFSGNKEVWLLYLTQYHRELSKKLAYALLRHGALKVQILFFPLGDLCYGK